MKTLIITGPTATGKTRLAVTLARAFDGEIVSADSRQVYAGLDIGTGKDLADYGEPPDQVPYHLIDVVRPDEEFHLLKFIRLAREALDDIASRGRLPIIAGGTPLYLDALLKGYRMPGGAPDPHLRMKLEQASDDQLLRLLHERATPELLARTDTSQRTRLIRAIEIAFAPDCAQPAAQPLQDTLILAPWFPRETVRERIRERLDQRLRDGLIAEVRLLHDQGLSWERLDWFGLEYRFVARHLRGELSLDDMRTLLLNKIRSFAKSQDIWFRKLEREGHPIHWLPDGNPERAAELVRDWLGGRPLPPPHIRLADIHYGPQTSRFFLSNPVALRP